MRSEPPARAARARGLHPLGVGQRVHACVGVCMHAYVRGSKQHYPARPPHPPLVPRFPHTQQITFVSTVPIDANRAVNRFCLIRNFAGWEGFDSWARSAMFKILGEDKVRGALVRPVCESLTWFASCGMPAGGSLALCGGAV